MSERCLHEPQVTRAVVENRWTDALRQHLTRCGECQAAAAVAPFMTAFARSDVRPRPLPDPAIVWLKAKLLRSSAVADRVTRPLNIAQLISYIVIGAGWAGLMTWKWADVQRWLLSFTPAGVVSDIAGMQSSVSAMVILATVVLSSLTVMVGLHAILAEE